MIGSSGVFVRPAVKEDTLAIADMLRDEGLSLPQADKPDLVIKHWERLWDDNPYYKESKEPVFYGWVLIDSDKVVGFFGYMPRVYFLNGKMITVQISTNWAIHKSYRRFAYSLCDAMFNGRAADLKITTTAIEQTGKIFSMFQSKRYPDPDFGYAQVIPLRIEKLLKEKFTKYRNVFAVLESPARLINYFLPVSVKSRLIWNTKEVQQITIENLPQDFQQFWNSYLETSSGLIASRSPEVMKWVYADVKNEHRKRIFVYRNPETNRLEGYSSLILEPVVSNPEIKRYKVGDILYLNETAKNALIKAMIKYSLTDGADVMEVHLVRDISSEDIPVYHVRRKTAAFPVFYHTSDAELSEFLSEKNNWYFTPYDGDTILG